MADTRLSDIIEPKTFLAREIEETTRLDAFVQTGIIATSDVFNGRAAGDGDITDLPFWNDLASGESNVATDDPAILSVPDPITMGKQIAIRHHREKDWGSMDLVANVLGQDPLDVIAGRVAKYWLGDRQKMLFAMLKGMELSNIANNGGDMIRNVANDSATAVADAEKLNANTMLEGRQTMGDAGDATLVGIGMHSRLATNLQQTANSGYVSGGMVMVNGVLINQPYATFGGYRVFVDDDLPITIGANRITYTSYLFGTGVFGMGVGTPKVPMEVWRNPAAGRGSGEERLYSRKQFIIHPRGFQCTATSATGKSPTNTELSVAAAWGRVLPRKKIPLVILRTNG